MEYILIDNFNDTLNIVCKDDGSGEPLIIRHLEEAKDCLAEHCQNGQIVPLGVDVIDIISKLDDFRSVIYSEEGEENFEKDTELDTLIDEILDSKEE